MHKSIFAIIAVLAVILSTTSTNIGQHDHSSGGTCTEHDQMVMIVVVPNGGTQT